ncbi:MAG TPA: tripartite tricarboxylate transporter substrate binding protein [Burkholderiales bacterium]
MNRLLLLVLFVAGNACAQYPSKPIRWIVPFPPGGPTDTFSRPVAAKLSEVVGQPVIIENVGGAGGSLGVDRVAKSAPDGYTIGLATTGTQTINPHLYGKRLAYDALKDFTPLTLGVRYVNLLVVNPEVPAKTVAELVAYAKANPGKVTFGSAGNGSSNHLSGEVLKYVTGAPMTHVPYKGSAAALTDVIAGNLTYMFDILVTALPQVHAGRVRALAVTSATRSPFAPDIPTMAESGVKGYSDAGADLWFGIIAPAGLPKAVTARLNEALVEALRAPDIRQRISAQSFELWTSTPEEFARVIRTDYDKWGRIVKASGASID